MCKIEIRTTNYKSINDEKKQPSYLDDTILHLKRQIITWTDPANAQVSSKFGWLVTLRAGMCVSFWSGKIVSLLLSRLDIVPVIYISRKRTVETGTLVIYALHKFFPTKWNNKPLYIYYPFKSFSCNIKTALVSSAP